MSSKHPITPASSQTDALVVPDEALLTGYAPPQVDEDEQPLDLRRYLSAVLRYKWLVLASTLAGIAGGVLLTRMQKPEYEAQATIWVESTPGSRGPIAEGQLLHNTNWIDLLTSYTVLDSVVRQQRLYLSGPNLADTTALRTLALKERFRPGDYQLQIDDAGRTFALSLLEAGVVQQGNVGDSVGNNVGFEWVPPLGELTPGRLVQFSVSTPRQAALAVSAAFDAVIPQREGNFIRMKLKGSHAGTTAATLNAIAEQFVRVAAELKGEKLRQYRQILEEQLQTARSDLSRAEMSLEGFRVATITLPSEVGLPVASGVTATQAPALQNFFQMRTEADLLRQDREAIERALRQPPDSGLTPVVLEAIPSVGASTELRAMLTDLTSKMVTRRAYLARYTASYQPAVDLAEEIATLQRQTIPAMLQSLLAQMRHREQDLDTRIAGASRDLREIPTRSINEARLAREMVIAQTLYTTLQQRYSEARLAELSNVPDVRILDSAVMPEQAKKGLPIFFLAGLAGGVGLGIGIALLLDRFDSRVRYPDQVSRELGLTILGAVPRVRANGTALRGESGQQVIEALRTIRLNLVYAYGSAGPLITAVTSPGSGDGKSFVASNLALAFADAGHRTLLIDADIRRGSLHRALDAKRKPGLLDCLSGQATREDIVQTTSIPLLEFIGCGTRKLGGPELLASAAMSQLLLSLRPQYSVVILDTAPLGAGVDPLVLGTLTGSLLLVMRTGVTDRDLTQAKLSDLTRLPIRILGAILNDVKPEGVYKYYSYLPGYGSQDEVEPDNRASRLKIASK